MSRTISRFITMEASPLTVTALILTSILIDHASADQNYWQQRAEFISNDHEKSLGATLKLNGKEQKVNNALMALKYKDFDDGCLDPEGFLAGQHFFKAKESIEKSKVFKFIKKLPKGASLHSHDTALTSQEYLLSLTYKADLYVCTENDSLKFKFFKNGTVPNDCNWILVEDMRKRSNNFDDIVKNATTLVVDNPGAVYPDVNTVWKRFMSLFFAVSDLIGYKPVWQEYFYNALKELYEDGVMYLEFRGIVPQVYDLEGKIYDPFQVVGLYYNTLKQFKKDHPNFHGARFIYAPSRKASNQTMDEYVNILLKLTKLYPDFIAGFDLVGQEDLGHPLTDYIDQLLYLKEKNTKFFFHAGETNWFGESTDLNLFDAILLNTTRIGHGYAILKHPQALKMVKERQIALEISPISNQVLKLVADNRNHPGTILIANGFPVVVTCDDPTFWGAKGLSHDWYVAFMAMSGRNGDLRLLKQLAINSIEFSAMEEEEKVAALKKWQRDWDRFIDDCLLEHFNEILLCSRPFSTVWFYSKNVLVETNKQCPAILY